MDGVKFKRKLSYNKVSIIHINTIVILGAMHKA